MLATLVQLDTIVLMEQHLLLSILVHLAPTQMLHTYSQLKTALHALLGTTVVAKSLLLHLVSVVLASTVLWAHQTHHQLMNHLMEVLAYLAFTAPKDHQFQNLVMEASIVALVFCLPQKENVMLVTTALERQSLANRLMASQEIFVHGDTFVQEVVSY